MLSIRIEHLTKPKSYKRLMITRLNGIDHIPVYLT